VSAESNAERVARMHHRLFESEDLDALDEFFADDFVSHSVPPGLPPGLDGVKACFAQLRAGLPDVRVAIDELFEADGRVAVATTISGTHEGELMGIAPTGRRVEVAGVDLLRFEDGSIVEHRGLTDTVGLLRQLTG